MSELTKEYIGKEFGIGDPTKADPDWPRDPEAVCVIETGEYLLPDECATIMNAMARELLSLRSAGDEEVDRMMVGIDNESSLSAGVKETFKILRYIAIARGKQLREAHAEIERLKGYITVLNGGGPPSE